MLCQCVCLRRGVRGLHIFCSMSWSMIQYIWKRGRVVEGARLEIVWAEMSRRFESSRFRQKQGCEECLCVCSWNI